MPILIVQGENDQYGTMRQIEMAQQECYCPVEVAMLPDTRHAPYREAPEATLRAISDFANRLLRDHHEGDIALTPNPDPHEPDHYRRPQSETSDVGC